MPISVKVTPIVYGVTILCLTDSEMSMLLFHFLIDLAHGSL